MHDLSNFARCDAAVNQDKAAAIINAMIDFLGLAKIVDDVDPVYRGATSLIHLLSNGRVYVR